MSESSCFLSLLALHLSVRLEVPGAGLCVNVHKVPSTFSPHRLLSFGGGRAVRGWRVQEGVEGAGGGGGRAVRRCWVQEGVTHSLWSM